MKDHIFYQTLIPNMQNQHHQKIKHNRHSQNSSSLSGMSIEQGFDQQDDVQSHKRKSRQDIRKSLKHVMSQQQRNIYDELLQEQHSNSSSNHKKSSPQLRNSKQKYYKSEFDAFHGDNHSSHSQSKSMDKQKSQKLQDYSYEKQSEEEFEQIVDHKCRCRSKCLQEKCACFQSTKSKCIKEKCCSICVQWKEKQINDRPGCLCKASKCLKLYCACYQNKIPCRQICKCVGCENKISQPISIVKIKETKTKPQNRNQYVEPDSCSCKKSYCINKYCQCYTRNKKCGKHCQCSRCKNKGKNYRRLTDSEESSIQQKKQKMHRKYLKHQSDKSIEDYLESFDKIDNQQIPQSMQFEPPDLQEMLKHLRM